MKRYREMTNKERVSDFVYTFLGYAIAEILLKWVSKKRAAKR